MEHPCLRQGGHWDRPVGPKVGQHWVLCLTALLLPPHCCLEPQGPQVVKLWAFCERSQH